MTLTTIFVPIAVVALLWHVTTTILIYKALRKRDVKVSFLFLRFLGPKYAQQYKEITLREKGKVGPLYLPLDRIDQHGLDCVFADSSREIALKRMHQPRRHR